MSHNPFFDFESSECVHAYPQHSSSSQPSSGGLENPANWAFTFDTAFDPLFNSTILPFLSTVDSVESSSCNSQDILSTTTQIASPAMDFASANATTMMSLGDSNPYNSMHIPDFSTHLDPIMFPVPSVHPSPQPSSAQASHVCCVTPSSNRFSDHSPSSSTSPRKRSLTPATTDVNDRAEKRRRNNVAAAKYRQKKLDRIEDLEKQLQTVCDERDSLKIALAKRDAEVEILRKMLEQKTSSST